MNWLQKLDIDETLLDDFIKAYEQELLGAKEEIKIDGKVELAARRMPSIVDKRFSQLQEVEAVLEMFNVKLKKMKSVHYRKYLEHYAKALSSRDVEKYIDGEYDVVMMLLNINKVQLLRNKFASITKALEIKHYQLTNIVKMKVAGLDDADLGLDN